MLHLLPVRQILSAVIALMGFGMLIAFSAGYLGSGDGLADILAIFRWSFAAAIALPLAASVAWRFAPVLQNATFPYLGGKWQGHLSFDGQYGSGARDVKLEIRHGLFGLNLMLDSPQATSRTLVAHAEYDAGLDRRRIYYVYLNERKEGEPAPASTIRVLRRYG
jgi:hypothetical protein